MEFQETKRTPFSDKWHLFWYIVLSYGISWSIWLIPVGPENAGLKMQVLGWSASISWKALTLILGNLGPGIAATILIYHSDGRVGLARLSRRFVFARIALQWYLLAALSPLVLAQLNIWLSGLHFSPTSAFAWVRVFFLNIFLGPLFEEIGWRGYLLPKLQLRHSGLLSSLFIALVWGPWHLPLHWGASFSYIGCFIGSVIALSVILTWSYNKTRGNLAIGVVLHAAWNASVVAMLGPAMALLGIRPFLQMTLLVCAVAIGILAMVGTNLSYPTDMTIVQ